MPDKTFEHRGNQADQIGIVIPRMAQPVRFLLVVVTITAWFAITDIAAAANSLVFKTELNEAGVATFWVTFVRVGDPKADRSWAEPVGMGLEIVPETDPTTLHEGDELPVRVLKNGAPYPEFSLNAVAAGEAKGETRKTDSTGRVVFRLNKPGMALSRDGCAQIDAERRRVGK